MWIKDGWVHMQVGSEGQVNHCLRVCHMRLGGSGQFLLLVGVVLVLIRDALPVGCFV